MQRGFEANSNQITPASSSRQKLFAENSKSVGALDRVSPKETSIIRSLGDTPKLCTTSSLASVENFLSKIMETLTNEDGLVVNFLPGSPHLNQQTRKI